jgi:hypothetical protein
MSDLELAIVCFCIAPFVPALAYLLYRAGIWMAERMVRCADWYSRVFKWIDRVFD